jgi:hypothetical protein
VIFTHVGAVGVGHDWEAEQAARPWTIIVHRPGKVDTVVSHVFPVRNRIRRVGVTAKVFSGSVTVRLWHPTLGTLWTGSTSQAKWFDVNLTVTETAVQLDSASSGVTVTLVG